MGPRTLIYNRPQIHLLGGIDAYVRLILNRTCTLRADIDWRAGRMKEFIDSHPEQVARDVTDLCKQIGLPLSGRQGRRLFKVCIGIAIGQYANYRRLMVAAKRLQTTDAPVKTI